jgi:hypothetical protein
MRFTIILLLIVSATHLTWGQTNKACYNKIYQSTDTLPILISSVKHIEDRIKRQIKIPDSLLNETGQTFIKYVINCRGEIVNLRSIKTADSDGNILVNKFEFLSDQLIKILKEELKWHPAVHGGETVDFLQIFSIGFRKGEMNIQLTGS